MPRSPASTSSSIAVLLTASSSAGPARPDRHGGQPHLGPDGRGHLGGHHRHQLHRGHRREVRHLGGRRPSPSTAPPRSPSRPRPAAGTVDVTVTTPGGTSTTSPGRPVHLRGSAPPTVTGVSPTSGPTAGGTSVTITGTNFTGATAVKFGSATGGHVHRQQRHLDHRHVPGGNGGTVDVTVTTAGRDEHHERPPTSSPTWLRASHRHRRQPHLGPDGRGHLGHHHRHQLHRGHRREVRRRRPRPFTVNSATSITARPRPGSGHRRRHGHHPGRAPAPRARPTSSPTWRRASHRHRRSAPPRARRPGAPRSPSPAPTSPGPPP